MTTVKNPTRFRQPYFGLNGKWLTFWITVACATDMTLFGYDQGVFSGVVISQNYLDTLDLHEPENTNILAIITSIYDIGCFFGALVAFTLGEKIGRKWSIMVGTTTMAVGAILQISAFSRPHMIVGRIVAGMGNGINTATAPVWQTETSPPKSRGKLVTIELMMNIFGLFLVNWINYGLSFVGGAIAWRLPLAIQFVFIFILWSTVPWLPESPRWLLSHGRIEEATKIIADLESKSANDPCVLANREEILFSIEYEHERAIRWRDLVLGRSKESTKACRRLLLGAGTQAMQQFSGTNIMTYYMPTLLQSSVGLSEERARLLTACTTIPYVFAAGLAAPLVERFGRRVMMMTSTGIQLFCFFMMTILLYFAQKPDYSGNVLVAEASVAFFFIYYIGFAQGMLSIPWLYPTEINSLPMRTKGAAVATATNWLANFIVVEVTPFGAQNIGWKFYIVWTCANAAFLPVIYFLYPETADRTLEDLDAYYRTNPSLIVITDKTATCRRRPIKYVEMQEADVQKASRHMEQASHTENIEIATSP